MKLRSSVIFYLNGIKQEVIGDDCFLPLANYLRKKASLSGTKIVCAEGDCGACSVLVAQSLSAHKKLTSSAFRVINSCIAPVYLFDASSLLTVEGLSERDGSLSEVQKSMVDSHGSQCGYCTPGFVVTLAAMAEEKKQQKGKIDSQLVKNYCTGNLCRCTGYEPIVKAGVGVDLNKCESLESRFFHKKIIADLDKLKKDSLVIKSKNKNCFVPTHSKDVAKILKKSKARIVSSATDLGVMHNKEKIDLYQVLSLHKVSELYEYKEDAKKIRIGAKVDLESLRLYTKKSYPEFSEFLNIFASLQIRNFATLVGNVANASPIGDTLPFLFVVDAEVEVKGPTKTKLIPITKFYKGYRSLNLKTGEWISAIIIPKHPARTLRLYKVSQRRDLDISSVCAAFLRDHKTSKLKVAYGGVGPTTLRLSRFEKYIEKVGFKKGFTSKELQLACEELRKEITPISDARASKDFRMKVSENLFRKFHYEEFKVL